MSVTTFDPYEREQAKDAALWIVAALAVAALHVGLVAAYLLLRPIPEGMTIILLSGPVWITDRAGSRPRLSSARSIKTSS